MTVARTICLGFLILIALGTGLLMLPIATTSGQWNDWVVALFTATSAVCVTGHAVVDTGSYFSVWGQVFIAILVQVGGLGYMTATTFLLLLLGRRFGLRDKIALQQALDRQGMQGTADVLRSIVATTMLFELTGVFLLLFQFVPEFGWSPHAIWLAIFHSVSAWNNAGFSLFSDNLMRYQGSPLVILVISGLIVFGGIGYETIFEWYLWLRDRLQGKAHRVILSLNFKVALSTTAALLIGGTLAFFFTELRNPGTLANLDWPTKLLSAWFQSVTCRTAGFNSIPIGQLTTASLFISIVLMFIGGSPGGTAGGIKTTTLRVLMNVTQAILQNKEDVLIYERQIPLSLILKAVGVSVGSLITVMVMTVFMSVSDPNFSFIQILFEVMSAFGTVGLSTGITATLTTIGKLLLVGTMYIGRVGILLLMSAILGDPKPSSVRYPEENLLVG